MSVCIPRKRRREQDVDEDGHENMTLFCKWEAQKYF